MSTAVRALVPRLAVPGSRSLGSGAVVVCALLAAAVSVAGPGGGVSVPDLRPAGGSATAAVPLSLTAAASSVIGAQGGGFRVLSRGGALVASGEGVSSSFTRAGVRLATADGAVRLSLVGAGYGARVIAVPGVAPVASGSSVSYRRTGLGEWYRNGPLGLEQGFTLARRPAGRELGPLTLALRVSGSLRGRRAGSGIVFVSAAGRPLLRYGGLSVRDAAGRSLPAQIAVGDGKVLLRVWDRGARYPVTVDPFIEQAKLIGPTSGQDLFGGSVALSPNGTTALIGAPSSDGDVGAAWVFVFRGGTWFDEQKLTAPTTGPGREIGEAQFGSSVALGLGGSSALIGGPLDNRDRGAAWAFVRKGATWLEQHKLIAPKSGPGKEIDKAEFGTGVALSSAGTHGAGRRPL